jgi:hypothetical protein
MTALSLFLAVPLLSFVPEGTGIVLRQFRHGFYLALPNNKKHMIIPKNKKTSPILVVINAFIAAA